MAESAPAPKSILRGHKAQVHAAAFIRNSERLVTGDADGFVVFWDLTIMRPRAVWRAHENAILGIRGWGRDKIITHGRDHKLVVWKLGVHDEERLSVSLPLADVSEPRPQPWILHILEVNTMNFCSFASCPRDPEVGAIDMHSASEILVAVPNTLASEAIDIYALPSQSRIYTIKPGQKNGMAMSLSLFHHEQTLTLVGAFENGYVSVHRLGADGLWKMTYRSQAHSQPVLSVDVGPKCEFFLTSAADSIIAKHPIPASRQEVPVPAPTVVVDPDLEARSNPGTSLLLTALQQTASSTSSSSGDTSAGKSFKDKESEHPLKVINTKHSGQQNLKVRSDGKIFATAGWDSKVRVYSVKSLKELAVLRWHKVGVYAVAFSVVQGPANQSTTVAATAKVSTDDDETTRSPRPLPLESTVAASLAKADMMSVKDRRISYAKTAHWIAAGAKDGNVSLWDIY